MCKWFRKLFAGKAKPPAQVLTAEAVDDSTPAGQPELEVKPVTIDLNQKLTRNFALYEFTRSATATKRGIDNTPTPEMVEAARLLCVHVMQPARSHFGPMTVTSGIRVPVLNSA